MYTEKIEKYLKKCGKGGTMKMNNKQYNNVIEYTLKHEETARTGDSLGTARAIFDNMGVALPQGDMKSVYETISTNNYMGWKSCTMQEAQAAADRGTAAIGLLSQIGWTEDNFSSSPSKKIFMERILVDVDTDGGNNIASRLHSKIPHREQVINKIIDYLGE